MINWSRYGGYEVSSKGDKRFSAFVAKMPDNRTIEAWYQCDVKAYSPGSSNWRLGKGKAPCLPYEPSQLYQAYLGLWRIWAVHHPELIMELKQLATENGHQLSDRFATTEVNQARALAQILNEWA